MLELRLRVGRTRINILDPPNIV